MVIKATVEIPLWCKQGVVVLSRKQWLSPLYNIRVRTAVTTKCCLSPPIFTYIVSQLLTWLSLYVLTLHYYYEWGAASLEAFIWDWYGLPLWRSVEWVQVPVHCFKQCVVFSSFRAHFVPVRDQTMDVSYNLQFLGLVNMHKLWIQSRAAFSVAYILV